MASVAPPNLWSSPRQSPTLNYQPVTSATQIRAAASEGRSLARSSPWGRQALPPRYREVPDRSPGRSQAQAAWLAACRNGSPRPGWWHRARHPRCDGCRHDRRRDIPHRIGAPFWHQRYLPPPNLGTARRRNPPQDGSFQHLCVHRGNLYATGVDLARWIFPGDTAYPHLVGGPRRTVLPPVLAVGPALVLHRALPRHGLGRPWLARSLLSCCRPGGRDLDHGRRHLLHLRCGGLRSKATQPVPRLVRLPRDLPRRHHCRLHLPLHGDFLYHDLILSCSKKSAAPS